MRAKQFITELADWPYDFKVWSYGDDSTAYEFTTDAGNKYVVDIATLDMDGDRGVKVDFGLLTGETKHQGVTMSSFNSDVTGTGDAARVFSTVRDIVWKSINKSYPPTHHKRKPVKYIVFAGKDADPSRVRLYQRIARNSAKYFPGFQLTSAVQTEVAPDVSGIQWTLTRNNQKP